jgi:hypothetical protein
MIRALLVLLASASTAAVPSAGGLRGAEPTGAEAMEADGKCEPLGSVWLPEFSQQHLL